MQRAEAIYRHCLKQIERCTDTSTKLESEWELAKRFNVPRRVTRFVLQRLVREGFAVAQHGRGYFAVPQATKKPAKNGAYCVGVVYEWVPEFQVHVQERIVSLVREALERRGLAASRIPISPTAEKVSMESPVDGYVLISLTPAAQLEYSHQKLPVVILGNTYEDLQLSNVYLDNLGIARDLCGRLFAQGHRQIALLQYKSRNLGRERTRIGFELAHHSRQIRFRRGSIIRVTPNSGGMRDCFDALRALPFTAMLVENRDLLGLVWSHAPESIRKRLAAMELGEIDEGVANTCPLAFMHVKTDFQAAARMVAKMLKDTFDGKQGKPVAWKIPWHVVETPVDSDKQ
ncbi:MAG: GntR family transcriptional regulator [Candidatus Hydrogenedentes bacterium]|nr:GntR family transcriptional regulator [Candidatus Hydrogenedentota bacterium]